jgi:putative ABC transport system permease protein
VVMQRRQEFGIRLSLGATPSSVQRLVFQRGIILTLLGLTAGGMVIGSTGRAGTEFLKSQGLLFGAGIHDLAILFLVGILLVLVSLAASFWPAWKATQVDPVKVLRAQ